MNKNLSPAKRALLEKWMQGQSNDDSTTIPRRPKESSVLLSFPQRRQLFLELLDRGTAVNNLSVFLELKGELDIDALKQSANKIIVRHDILRTCFSVSKGLPVPEVIPDCSITLPIVDFQKFNATEQAAEARRLAEKEVLQPLDLAQAPLIRLKLFALSKEDNLLLVIVHLPLQMVGPWECSFRNW